MAMIQRATEGGGSWPKETRHGRREGTVPSVCPSRKRTICGSSMIPRRSDSHLMTVFVRPRTVPGELRSGVRTEGRPHVDQAGDPAPAHPLERRLGLQHPAVVPHALHDARTAEVEGPLFLRKFGVPFWALARVFGGDPMSWYRLECGLGRFSVVGTTVRTGDVARTSAGRRASSSRSMARRSTSLRPSARGAVWERSPPRRREPTT